VFEKCNRIKPRLPTLGLNSWRNVREEPAPLSALTAAFASGEAQAATHFPGAAAGAASCTGGAELTFPPQPAKAIESPTAQSEAGSDRDSGRRSEEKRKALMFKAQW
jgi:hypothetical protein